MTYYSSEISHKHEPSFYNSKPGSLGAHAKCFHVEKHDKPKNKIVIIGIPDDRGVKLNGGKGGAAEGPTAFRKAFYALADRKIWNTNTNIGQHILDAGDVVLAKSIAETHSNLAEMVKFFVGHGAALVVVVGGGHDFSYGSYLGHAQSSGGTIPIINFDAHFDLRPLTKTKTQGKAASDGEENINSGTPFYRVIENLPQHINGGKALLELGIQQDRNSESLYEYAHNKGVKIVNFDALLRSHFVFKKTEDQQTEQNKTFVNLKEHTKDFLDSCEAFGWSKYTQKIHLSLDLDVFSQSIAPGTSASTPFGLELSDAGSVLSYLSKAKLAKVLDVAELCPVRDVGDITSRLAASVVFRFACDALEPL